MKILHVTESIKGGIAAYIDEIAEYQTDTLGQENVRFLLPHDWRNEISRVSATQIGEFCGFKRTIGDLFRYAMFIRSEINRFSPDVVHLHSTFPGLIGRLVLLFSRRAARVVYQPHGWCFQMEVGRAYKSGMAFVERILAAFTDVIVNISNSEQQAAINYGIQCRRQAIILSGIRDSDFIRILPRPDDKTIRLLFVGRFDKQKGIDRLLDIAGRLDRKIHISIVGASVRQEFSIPNLDNVTVLGWLSREELQQEYVRADALVMPSRWEGFGFVAVESLRAGTPVLASQVGALPEIVEDGINGHLLNFFGESGIVDFLNGLNVEKLGRMRMQSRSSFLKKFESSLMNASLIEIYQQIFDRPFAHRIRPWGRGTVG